MQYHDCYYCTCIFYRLSMQIREKISSHRLYQMRMHCECWVVGVHMVYGYVICMEPGWLSLGVFKTSVWRAI